MMKKVKTDIALVGPLSGPRSDYGRMLAQVADKLKHSEGIECELFDDEAQPDAIAACTSQIISCGARIVVGHLNSFCATLAAPVYLEKGIPLLLPAATKAELTHFKNVFRICPDEGKMLDMMVAVLEKTPRLAVFCDGSRYGAHLLHLLRLRLGRSFSCVDKSRLVADTQVDTVLALGVHRNLAELILHLDLNNRSTNVICCDDAAVDEFEHMVAQTRQRVSVIYPVGGFEESVERALRLADQCMIEAPHEPMSYLQRHQGFCDREYTMSEFTLRHLDLPNAVVNEFY
ncbi:ABC transporter substrate-binding protein [Pseudoalteromonas ardens]|nr:ABC transporter substrate-binding protein [Pseudoalteromonas sp. R96]MDK1313540.1 ABC transporter substrate-binding protein [Pseudoalteromonas sp. R96]